MTNHDIYATLFNRIIHNEYPQDSWLREDHLAKEFQRGRTSVRNVLLQLEQDGLIERLPKRGVRVLSFSADDLEDIYEILRSLEMLALEMSVHVLSIQKLLEMRSEIEELKNATDYMRIADLDTKLHTYLVQSCGKKRIIASWSQLYRLVQTFREIALQNNDIRNEVNAEHLEIIDALCTRDKQKALQTLGKHFINSRIRILTQVMHESSKNSGIGKGSISAKS
jgi:DNA-binding GntR family transcriptional regulator